MLVCFKSARRLALAALVTVGLPAMLAAQIFVEFTNPIAPATAISGESLVVGFQNQIEAFAVTTGASNTVAFTAKGPASGKVSLREIKITKPVDRATPGIFRAVAAGGFYGRVNISFVRPNTSPLQVYYKIELNDAFITSTEIAGADSDRPVETLTINYSAVRYTYSLFPQGGGQPTTFTSSWSQVTNREDFRNKEESVANPVPPGTKPASTGTEITVE